jgi:signal peptidase I
VFDQDTYEQVRSPAFIKQGKWRLFAFGCVSSVLPGAGQFLRELRTRGYLWISAFVLFLVANVIIGPWRSPDGRLPVFLIGAAILCAAGIDAAFVHTEEDLRPTVWGILIFASMAFITSISLDPAIWKLNGYRSYSASHADMEPTIVPGDELVADLHAYRHTSPERGDVVIAQQRKADAFNWIARPSRVIAVPGDTIEGKNGQIILNNVPIQEAYVPAGSTSIDVSASADEGLKKRYTFGPVKLEPGEYFLMGDNRGLASDSRINGPVKVSSIRGKALYILSSDDTRDGHRLD